MIAIALEMASFTPNLNPDKLLGSIVMFLSVTLSSSPSLAQLPELPPAPPAPPASPETSPAEIAPAAPPASPNPEISPSQPAATDATFIRPQTSCPQDFDTLSTLLVRDIPGYTNRILQSSVADIPTAYRPAYVVTANPPDRMPLDIKDRVYTTNPDTSESLHQLFFTTLERQYSGLDATSISHFHWLFLTPSETGWEMVFMFSAIDTEDAVQLPPRDSSYGSIAQAVRRWLIDCQANAIFIE